MVYFFAVILLFVLLVVILAGSVSVGRRVGQYRIVKHPDHKIEADSVAESAIFGLLALLIAFSFSGAYERLEHRKMHVLEEASVFRTAYKYIDLLAPKYQPVLREYVREYIGLHLAVYNDIPNLDKVHQDMRKAKDLEQKIWRTTVEACETNTNKSLFILLMPAMDNMFVTSHTGINMARVHPPIIIFILLIGLAAAGSFLIGYNSAEVKEKRYIHIFSYVLLTALTIYIIVNIEYPRTGFIRLNYFDQILIDVKNDMK